MEAEDYCNLVDKEVLKEYKKANSTEILAVKNCEIDIVKKLKLEDRVMETSERQCFATLKDHKDNFVNNPKVRLIDPMKSDVGKVSKQILEKINKEVRQKSGLNQWTSTGDVVNWFKEIKDKPRKKFIKFDVVNFYP